MNLRNFDFSNYPPPQRIAHTGVTALWVLFWLVVIAGLIAVIVGVQG